jgi:hypothetical protein
MNEADFERIRSEHLKRIKQQNEKLPSSAGAIQKILGRAVLKSDIDDKRRRIQRLISLFPRMNPPQRFGILFFVVLFLDELDNPPPPLKDDAVVSANIEDTLNFLQHSFMDAYNKYLNHLPDAQEQLSNQEVLEIINDNRSDRTSNDAVIVALEAQRIDPVTIKEAMKASADAIRAATTQCADLRDALSGFWDVFKKSADKPMSAPPYPPPPSPKRRPGWDT